MDRNPPWIRADQRKADEKAGSIIDACESYKQAHGDYPDSLNDLVPEQLSEIPPARSLGRMNRPGFQYFRAGPNSFTSRTNTPVLLYVARPPFGKRYCLLEEAKWSSYD